MPCVPIIVPTGPRTLRASACRSANSLHASISNPSSLDRLILPSILSKLHHNVPSINFPTIQALDGLLSFICVLVPDKSKTSRLSSPAISGNEDVYHLSIPVEQRVKVVRARTESNVEHKQRVGVSDVRRTSPPEMRHACFKDEYHSGATRSRGRPRRTETWLERSQ